jgi:hypothetical protein
VQNTLIYATNFSSATGLQAGAAELMFHALRQTVAHTPGIDQVFVRRYKGGNGMDQYYLMRGAKLVWKPAKLQLHPAIKWFFKCFQPRQYAVLRGSAKDAA